MPHSLDRRTLVLALLNAIKHLPQAERQAAADALQSLAAQALPGSLMMRREEVRSLIEAGMDVGGHTRSHPILSSLSAERAEEEIAGGLDDLASITGRRPTLFAYPNGRRGLDYGDREVALAPAPRARRSAGDASRHRDARLRSPAGTAADTAASPRGAIRLRALARVCRAAVAAGIGAVGARVRRRLIRAQAQGAAIPPRASSQSSSAVSTQTSSP